MSQIEQKNTIGANQAILGLAPEKKAGQITSEITRGPISFRWVNVAVEPTVNVGQITSAIRESEWINPPRTAHIGGKWSEIMAGRGNELILNLGMIQDKTGYPLIFDLNQTPNADGNSGDILYEPGVRYENGKKTYLPLKTWDGHSFQTRDRDQSLFTPFIMTEADGKQMPLITLHRKEMKNIHNFKFVSQEVVNNAEASRRYFKSQLYQASLADDPTETNKVISMIFDRHVTRDGVVHDGAPKLVGGQYRLGEQVFKSQKELIDAAMKSFEVAANPQLLEEIASFPSHMPLISKEALVGLLAALDTDKNNRSASTPVNLHVHMGAVSMAGIPPNIHGYFPGSSSAINSLWTMYRAGTRNITSENSDVPKLYYVLFPAALYMFSVDADDYDRVNALVGRVAESTSANSNKPELLQPQIITIITNWVAETNGNISPQFRSRFDHTVTVPTDGSTTPTLSLPEQIKALNMRQVMYTLGSLMQVFSQNY